MKCPLCGYEFEEKDMACHASCPMHQGCNLICCPNCGYQTVDESRSRTAGWLKKLIDRARAPTLDH